MHVHVCSCLQQILRKRCRAFHDRQSTQSSQAILAAASNLFSLPSAGTGSGVNGGHGSELPGGVFELFGCLLAHSYQPCTSATQMFMQSMERECSFRPVPRVTEGKVDDDPPDGSI
jgi:hypothetical protein